MIALLLFSYVTILVYMITQRRGTAERNAQRAREFRDQLRQTIGFSAANEISKLDVLRRSGSITDQEFARLGRSLFNDCVSRPAKFLALLLEWWTSWRVIPCLRAAEACWAGIVSPPNLGLP